MSRIQPITMPKWGIEMQEGTITAWNFAPGQVVGKGDGLLDVETEKIVNSVESPANGTLRRILADTGDTCPVGALIAVFAEPGVPEAEIDEFIAGFQPADTSFEPDAEASAESPPTLPPAEPGSPGGGESKVSPIARRLADKLGIDASRITGTGRNGRVSKEDVEAYAVAQGLMPDPAGARATTAKTQNEPTRERMSSMRLTIARRLSESKQTIPHYRLSVELDIAALLTRRGQLASEGVKVSLNDLLLRACALTLAAHPRVNAQFTGEEVLCFPHADLAVAVATDAGLVTPIVRAADTKEVQQIAAEVADLAARARSGQLRREEISGGTFTVSNLGMYGVEQFDAIINPPQVAILAVGVAADRVVARVGRPAVARMMTAVLSCDHRVVDGATGGRFLADLKQRIESGQDR